MASAWSGRGRLIVAWPGGRRSSDCVVRAKPESLRLAVLDDAGVLLADLELAGDRLAVHQAVAELRERALPQLERLLRAWRPRPAPAERAAGAWEDDRLVVREGGQRRWYGGDPLLLRLVEDDGWPIALADHRPRGDGLVAHQVRADGPLGAAVELRLAPAAE